MILGWRRSGPDKLRPCIYALHSVTATAGRSFHRLEMSILSSLYLCHYLSGSQLKTDGLDVEVEIVPVLHGQQQIVILR